MQALDEDTNDEPQKFVSGTIENNGTGTSTLQINQQYTNLGMQFVDHSNTGGTGILAVTIYKPITFLANNTYTGPDHRRL